MTFRVFSDRIKIYDSCEISKRNFHESLFAAFALWPTCPLWGKRSERSLKREWAAHNLAYSLGIKRDKTKDVDLNFEQKWYVELMYFIVGTIALWLIK